MQRAFPDVFQVQPRPDIFPTAALFPIVRSFLFFRNNARAAFRGIVIRPLSMAALPKGKICRFFWRAAGRRF